MMPELDACIRDPQRGEECLQSTFCISQKKGYCSRRWLLARSRWRQLKVHHPPFWKTLNFELRWIHRDSQPHLLCNHQRFRNMAIDELDMSQISPAILCKKSSLV